MNANAEPTDGHLDSLGLDALRAGEGTSGQTAHAEACTQCRAALAGLAALEARLKAAQPQIPHVPPQLEERIFRSYRERVAKPAPAPFPALLRRWALPVAGLTAAAAAVTLALRLAPMDEPEKALHEPARVAKAPSVPAALEAPNAAAGVDIVDAFLLARALRDGRLVASGWDADGNGLVDGTDVQAVARRAVTL